MRHFDERRDHRTYLALEQLLLLQGEDLAKSTFAVQKHIMDLVSAGQAKAWSIDLAKAQALLTHRLGDLEQGFDNELIGRLLCPITRDWNSEESRRSLREAPQTITTGSWPTVFYQNMEFERQRPWEGFLRNSLLVMTYRHIFRDLARPLLEPYQGLSLISIAYIATLVTVTLASDSSAYASGINKHLFNLLASFLYEHRESNEAKELVLWWDRSTHHSKHRCTSSLGTDELPRWVRRTLWLNTSFNTLLHSSMRTDELNTGHKHECIPGWLMRTVQPDL
ncbi:hypothetical protein BKA70DRAFT_1440390 [Coprinopsis sp. MPI-PUGE-AT-0042]|nr:hypothetical protein BKA70DRAFT_1440390 [Coprinopsis sp. MPI-PUGE-AT-0042]